MSTRILGVSAYYHDSAAALVDDGHLVAAAQEERFTRKKHDAGFPSNAIAYCLSEAGIGLEAVDLVGFYEKPLVKFDRLLETYLGTAPRGLRSFLTAMPVWLHDKLWAVEDIQKRLAGYTGEVLFGAHHESHAASAFYPSPFEEAAIITMDGVGEWATSSLGLGRGAEIELHRQQTFPHSLGLLYSAFTYFTGFRVNSGEYKLMGLAPYGEPTYVNLIKDHLVQINEDGSVWMNMDYFTYPHTLTMTGAAFERLFGGPPRKAEGGLTQREMDLARSIQEITEEAMLKTARFSHRETGMRDLCLAGGVALNCVGNGRILRDGPFEQIWIQPAAGDAGGAVGIALAIWHRHLGNPRTSPERAGTWERPADLVNGLPRYADGMSGALLGPSFSDEDIARFIAARGCPARKVSRTDLPALVARLIAEEKVVGLFQDRMEFGPRALGARSILGDARSPRMQSVMNLKIKFRESFRPFAPAVLRERVSEWFDLDTDSPYMLLVAPVSKPRQVAVPAGASDCKGLDRLNVLRSTIPAVTHVDHSARVQTVRREHNPLYYDIIQAFDRLTGCPVVVNTSFNLRGEPIVCTPEDAYRCFMRSNIDVLVLESYVLEKGDQPELAEGEQWRTQLTAD
jgi:carbamoyltransferase